jgi:hypothetical protein
VIGAHRRRLRALLLAAGAALSVVLIVALAVFVTRDDNSPPRVNSVPSPTAPRNELHLPAYVRSDCPEATPKADGVPRAIAEQLVARTRAQLLASTPSANEVRVVPSDLDLGQFELQVLIGDRFYCPDQPMLWQGVPVLFTLGVGTPPPPATGAAIVTGARDGLDVRALDGRLTSHLASEPVVSTDQRVGRFAIVQSANSWSLVSASDGRVMKLAGWQHVWAGAFGNSVWVASGSVLQELDLQGNAIGAPREIRPGRSLTQTPRAVISGLITYRGSPTGPTLEVWDPVTDRVEYAIGHAYDVLDTYNDPATGSSSIAWVPRDCPEAGTRLCDLAITSLPDGTTRMVPAPAGTFGFLAGGAFSPDGRTFAAFLHAGASLAQPAAELALVDAATGSLHRVAGSHVALGQPRAFASWTPDGAQIYFGGAGVAIGVYAAGDAAATQSSIPPTYGLTIVPV